MGNFSYINGKFCSPGLVAVADRGFLLGDGVFTTIKVNKGTPEFLAEHLTRLKKHAQSIMIDIPPNFEKLPTIVERILIENELNSTVASLRITLTRGEGGRGLDFPKNCSTGLFVTASTYTSPKLPLKLAINKQFSRVFSPISHIKTISYLPAILAREEAKQRGYDDAILVNEKWHLVCTTAGNIFVQIGGSLFTPPLTDGCLEGITRRHILSKNPHIKEQSIPLELLDQIEGAFVTNSLMGIGAISHLELRTLEKKDFNDFVKT
jgi:branched-chain amino acid aminotransferase